MWTFSWIEMTHTESIPTWKLEMSVPGEELSSVSILAKSATPPEIVSGAALIFLQLLIFNYTASFPLCKTCT